jgi:energy-coupling factor transporter ATP-binding protein EcfA2
MSARSLTGIEVTGLFGVFDHRISLNRTDRITVLLAPNGFGKTAILRLINAFLAGQYEEFFRTPISTFRATFSDGRHIEIRRTTFTIGESGDPQFPQQMTLGMETAPDTPRTEPALQISGWADKQVWTLPLRGPYSLNSIERRIPFLERIGARSWMDQRTGRRMNLDDVMRFYPEFGRASSNEPEWLAETRKDIPCYFIETQRLLNYRGREEDSRQTVAERNQPMRLMVQDLAVDCKRRIERVLTEYAAEAQQLDSSFPKRLITETEFTQNSASEIEAKLTSLSEERAALVRAGLLVREDELPITALQIDQHQHLIPVLNVYVRDTEKKLAIFNDIYSRFSTLTEIINRRFLYKKIRVDRENGLAVVQPSGKTIALEALSSGEQHELILIYHLLFSVQKGSLILIDEPELSLHVAWQKEFLNDLGRILSLGDLSSLIATHSPQIINERWDLTVELRGPAL